MGKFFEAAFQNQILKDNIAAGKIKRLPYVMEFNLSHIAAGRNGVVLQQIAYQQQQFDEERLKLEIIERKLLHDYFTY